jgi:TAG lipase / steryl ester hydrolase / phospholipase A2 / LPA acyltransferase
LCLNAVLLGLVHVAIALNKYVLPAWFQRARVIVRESAGGVDHRGRANAHYTDERQAILVELEHATTYAEWRAVASKLDSFPADVGEGGVAWRADDHSEAYDSRLVGVYLNAMSSARERNDLTALGLCLRTVLHRNFGGIDRLLSLRFARVGTKKLVEAFRDEIVATIEHIAATDDKEHAIEMLQVLKESYRSLGRTALCLSGGGALAMYHFGVLKVLLSEGLCPQVISGTSGGSIVAAYLGCVPPNELLETITPDIPTRYSRRWFPRPHKMALHFLQHGVLMDSEGFSQTTKAYFGDTTFEEAFQLSGRALSIQVSIGSQTGYVLNHLTSPAVLLRTAVCASCALPGLMRPVEILAKDKSGNLVPFHPPDVKSYDGTITQDIPSARLTELFNCNNFIVSQVNPHLNFVLHLAEESHGRRQKTARSYQRRNAVQKLLRVANFLLLNIKYGIQKLLEVDLFDIRFVRTLQGVLMQDFRGHITILPSLKWRDYSKIGAQPSERDMQRFITRGEQATWPHVEVIRYTMQVETVLVNAIRALSKRVDAMGAGTVKRTSSHGFLEH